MGLQALACEKPDTKLVEDKRLPDTRVATYKGCHLQGLMEMALRSIITGLIIALFTAADFVIGAAMALESKTITPAHFVRVCNAFGEAYFTVPGSRTCLAFDNTGTARGSQSDSAYPQNDAMPVAANAFLNQATTTDMSAMNDWGRVRAFALGVDAPASAAQTDSDLTAQAINTLAILPASQLVRRQPGQWMLSYLKRGGLTLGRAPSAFNLRAGNGFGPSIAAFGPGVHADVLSYTITSGTGVAATLSLENNGRSIKPGVIGKALAFSPAADQSTLPDVVAALSIANDWGSAQIAGALHPLNRIDDTNENATGWAIAGGMTLNLPFLAANDTLSFQAAYSDGALVYNGVGSELAGLPPTADAQVESGDSVKTSTALSLSGGVTRKWNARLSGSVSGSYLRVDQPNGGAGALDDFGAYNIIGNLQYSPADDLVIGAELGYQSVKPEGKPRSSSLGAILRLKRDF